MTSWFSHMDIYRNSSLRNMQQHMQYCLHTSVLFSKCFFKVKGLPSRNSFLTTTGECSFKCLNTELFKLKCFVFILKHSFEITLIIKEMSMTALPCLLRAVFTMRFAYKGHAHQLYGFATTLSVI